MPPKSSSDRSILFISSGWIHPPRRGRQYVRKLLECMPDIHVHTATSMEALTQRPLRDFAALVLYFHDKTISPEALAVFDAFVREGGGVLAIHSATASFKGSQGYFDILGGRFIGHGPVESIKVEPVHGRDEAFAGVSGFTIKDELYLHDLADDIEVQFYAMHEGERAPMVWTRHHGRGRVCYVCPGHRSQSLEHPHVQQILEGGLRWVCE